MNNTNAKPAQKGLLACKKWLLILPLALSLTGCGSEFMEKYLPGTVSAEDVEEAAAYNYKQVIAESRVLPANNKQTKRVRTIANRLIPIANEYNSKAPGWTWEVNVIQSQTINAWCMAGGKIAFYTGIIDTLKLTDDEIAMIMGHEMVHALEEHIYYQINKAAVVNFGVTKVKEQAGGGNEHADSIAKLGESIINLSFSRSDETTSDLIGQEIAARAGYNPKAAISVWEKFQQLGSSGTPEYLSTHPSNENRIAELEKNLPKVTPLYQEAIKKGKK